MTVGPLAGGGCRSDGGHNDEEDEEEAHQDPNHPNLLLVVQGLIDI